MHQEAPTSNRPICNKAQVASICVTSSRLPTHGSRCTQTSLGGPGPYAFPPVAILGKVVMKLRDYLCRKIILIAPGWPNMPWFWDLVAMSNQVPLYLPNLLIQSNVESKSACMAPRASVVKEQGFTGAAEGL